MAIMCVASMCGIHSHWSAVDQKVGCMNCAPARHHGPPIRIRESSSVDLTSSSDSAGYAQRESRELKRKSEVKNSST
eukprot:5683508-Amphidinium_carterae.1